MPATISRSQPEACSLLDADHRKVKKMFKDYDELTKSKAASASQKKRGFAEQICLALTVHAQIEEEIFYPVLSEAIKDTALLDEAEVEHASAKDLIAQIQKATDVDDKFDAKVTVLGEYIDHQVKGRGDIFTKARAAKKLDLVSMREVLQARDEELMAGMAGATALSPDAQWPEERFCQAKSAPFFYTEMKDMPTKKMSITTAADIESTSAQASGGDTSPSEATSPAQSREEQVRLAAYLAAERRGFEPGYEVEDWITAEQEVEAAAGGLGGAQQI